MKIPKKFSEILFLVEISSTKGASSRNARSGFLDADSLLTQAEMFMQPDAFKRFKHFYDQQVSLQKMILVTYVGDNFVSILVASLMHW